jgi:hypothetical protein
LILGDKKRCVGVFIFVIICGYSPIARPYYKKYTYYISIIFQNMYIHYFIFKQISKQMAHNVPVVYDVFAARIRACEARPGLQKCGGVLAWE